MTSAQRSAGVSGIAFGVLFAAGSAIWGLDMPERGTPAPEVLDFYSDTADRIVVGASLSLLAIAVFVFFAAAVRRVLIEAEGDDLLATTAFGGGVLGMTVGLGAETINMAGALRAQDGQLNEQLAQALFEISQMLGSTASGLGGGIFGVAVGLSALRSGVLPRWVAALTLVVGLALLTPLSHMAELPGGAAILLSLVIGLSLLRTGAEAKRS